MPGIIDSHYHPILSGLLGTSPDSVIIDTFTDNCKSLKDMFQILDAAVKIKEKGEWISMMGYEPLLLPERRHPTIDELDECAPENPVHCMHGGGHICMYNTKDSFYPGYVIRRVTQNCLVIYELSRCKSIFFLKDFPRIFF